MNDQDKTMQQLVEENAELRRRVAALEAAQAGWKQAEQDNPFRLASVVTDISDREAAEEALRESSDQLETIYDSMVEGLVITDIETKRFLRVNASFCQMLGYSEEELLAASLKDIHPSAEVPNELERFQAAAEGRVSINEERPVLRKDGTIFYADITGRRIFYDGRPCLLGLFRDVTERRRMAESLRQSHDELQVIYDGMVDGLVVFDIESREIVRANAAHCKMVGYREEELRSLSPEQRHPLDALPKIKAFYDAVLQGRKSSYDAMPCLRRDGTLLYFDVVSKPVSYSGRPCHLLFFHDVTERQRAHEALQKQRHTLKHLLQSSDHERQLIAYEIHDGLAQHLAGAIMQFDAFDHLKDTKPKRAADAFHAGMTILRQGHSEARRLISGVRPPILDEAGVVAAVSHLVNEERRNKGPKIEYASEVEFERLTPILENAIYRIVQEGLTNACRHSKSKEVRVELVQHGDLIRIVIQDRGIGFTLDNIGDSHFGVAGIRERARLLGGSATIDSEAGKGTRIVVELPVVLRKEEDE